MRVCICMYVCMCVIQIKEQQFQIAALNLIIEDLEIMGQHIQIAALNLKIKDLGQTRSQDTKNLTRFVIKCVNFTRQLTVGVHTHAT